jgi:hypothetical protein
MPAKLTLIKRPHILTNMPLTTPSFHIHTTARGVYRSALSWCNKMNHYVVVLPLTGGFSGALSSTDHRSPVTLFPRVAALLPGCYDLVFHDPG